MAWQPQEMVLVRTVLYRERVHRQRSTHGFDRIRGSYQEWLVLCGSMVTGYTRADQTGSHTHAMDRIWAWQANLLGMPFCHRCFPEPDQPPPGPPVNLWRPYGGR